MRLILAPMEGVVDHLMRALLTAQGGFDLCITEYVRVVDQLLPSKVFYRICPELRMGAVTPAGVPVRLQLLGQHPGWMAENAQRAVMLGSPGVDLNFGCPAKHVNRSRGGAILLNDPEQIYRIVAAVRAAVPAALPVSAKIRLGWDCTQRVADIAQAVASAGAAELAVHARTKADGYRAETIKWSLIKPLVAQLPIPVIANGEIWSAADAQRCRLLSGTRDLMLGRGALALPNLAAVIDKGVSPLSWSALLALLVHYSKLEQAGDKGAYYPSRIKQWFCYLKQHYPEAEALFQPLRTCKTTEQILALLNSAHKEC